MAILGLGLGRRRHAARIAPDKAFGDVMPGKSVSYTFRANDAGVFMYHCGTKMTAKPGELVRFWVVDAGPSLDTDFHWPGVQ